jgi:protein TonB
MPEVITRVNPEYTAEARKAGLSGTVTISLVVGADGSLQSLRVVRSLGLGLDEKAIEAVKKWKIKPGTKDGKPVSVIVTVEVNFRLRGDRGDNETPSKQ